MSRASIVMLTVIIAFILAVSTAEGQQRKLASAQCVAAAASPKLDQLADTSLRMSLNLLKLKESLIRVDHFESQRAGELGGVATELFTLTSWLWDIGSIASAMETENDKSTARFVLHRAATLGLIRQETLLNRTNFNLAHTKNPPVGAEGRALRDAVERFASLLAPCR